MCASYNKSELEDYLLVALAGELSRSSPIRSEKLIELLPEDSPVLYEGITALCASYLSRGEADNYLNTAMRAFKLAEKDESLVAEAKRSLGQALWYKGRADEAMELLEEAKRAAQHNEDRVLGAHVELSIGLVHGSRSEYDKAIEHYKRALSMHQEIGSPAYEANCFGNMADAYINLGEISAAYPYCTQALSMHREVGNLRGIRNNLRHISIIHKKRGEYQEALEHLYQALDFDRTVGNRGTEGVTLGEIGSILLEQGNDFSESRKCLQMALEIGLEVNKARNIKVEIDLARCDEALGNINEARKAASDALILAEELNITDDHHNRDAGKSLAHARRIAGVDD